MVLAIKKHVITVYLQLQKTKLLYFHFQLEAICYFFTYNYKWKHFPIVYLQLMKEYCYWLTCKQQNTQTPVLISIFESKIHIQPLFQHHKTKTNIRGVLDDNTPILAVVCFIRNKNIDVSWISKPNTKLNPCIASVGCWRQVKIIQLFFKKKKKKINKFKFFLPYLDSAWKMNSNEYKQA